MAGELDIAELLGVRRIDTRKSAITESNVEPLRRRVIPNVIRIVPEPNGRTCAIVVGVQELETFTLSVRDRHQLRVRHNRDSLRLAEPGDTLNVRASLDVEHFDGVVTESRNEQSLAGRIERQMIDSAFDTWQFDGPCKRERLLRGRQLHGNEDHSDDNWNAHHACLLTVRQVDARHRLPHRAYNAVASRDPKPCPGPTRARRWIAGAHRRDDCESM